MARSHLTLAALATSAVSDLDLVASASFGSPDDGDFESAILTGRDGRHWIIRIPRNQRAETEQSADLVALRAVSAGIRTRLPFAVSTFAGHTPVAGTRATVYEFVYGSKLALQDLDAHPGGISESIGRAVAAIHTLPTSFVTDAGLPVLGSLECLRSVVTVMDRAAATGLVPAPLLTRWENATEDTGLWQFQPTVTNGSLTADSFLAANGAVTGVLGWHDLRVGDPAKDLAWILANPDPTNIQAIMDSYNAVRGAGDRQVLNRAMLYAELDVARWLLHGVEKRSTEIVDDAVAMLSTLVDDVQNDVMNPLSAQTMPTMAVDEVEAFLDRNSRAV
jgi:aminoglycoside phosphotransferase (APT) family kinase protein